LQKLNAAADGSEFEFAGTHGANQGAAGGLDDDIAGDFLEVDIACHALELHVAIDLLDVDEASLRLELELGLFGNGKLKIGFDIMRLRGSRKPAGIDIDAIADLLDIDGDFIGRGDAGDNDFVTLRGLYLDAAVDDVLQHDDGPILNGKMTLLMLWRIGEGRRGSEKEQTRAQ